MHSISSSEFHPKLNSIAISSLSLSLCKGDKRNSLIEPLPSSFSHLYSGRPENIGLQIPTKDQEVKK